MTKFLITIDRDVCESATCEFKDLNELKEYLKKGDLFEEIDRQAAERDDDAWEEICGEILDTHIAELDENEEEVKSYLVIDGNKSLVEED